MRTLILAPFSESGLAVLRQWLDVSYESWLETQQLQDPDELASKLRDDHVGLLVVEADFVFANVFEAASSLKLVGVCRNSTSHIDLKAATRHGVLVVNTPARNARAVAEHTLGLMLALARQVQKAHRYVESGCWRSPVEPYLSMRGIELSGRTLGIIGLGAIGRYLASIAGALGMRCIAYDPYVSEDISNSTLVRLEDLLRESDFISIHVPLTMETKGLFGEVQLDLMKPSAYLLNLSDAAIVEENALVAALRGHRIAGAALDVFETHPITPHSPLLSLENVVLTPHLGGATEETIERHSQMMVDDIQRFLMGKRPNNLINVEAWGSCG